MQKKRIITSKEIGERIKKRRVALGLSQEKVADALGVTYQQVQRYENGTNRLKGLQGDAHDFMRFFPFKQKGPLVGDPMNNSLSN